MNIKNIKALNEAKVYPENMLMGMNCFVEDIPPPDNAKCMPYFIYPIPTIDQLIVLIIHYSSIKIFTEMTEMGFIMNKVSVNITSQDTIEKEFFSPFLDDALAEALLELKKNSDEKQKALT